MTRVRERATVHPATVTKVSRGTVQRRKRARQVPVQRAPRLTRADVHPEVWATALGLAGGRASHLEVVSPTEVLVHNQPVRRRHVT